MSDIPVDIRVPIGLCTVTFGDTTLDRLADAATFEAIPKYQKGHAGFGNTIYFLESYDVSLTMYLSSENYETLQLAISTLQGYGNGFLDQPNKIDRTGKTLIIHPNDAGDSKEYDIVIFRAIVDPEQSYKRKYDKTPDNVAVRFIGLPYKSFNGEVFKSYFFIGDWQEAGVLNAS